MSSTKRKFTLLGLILLAIAGATMARQPTASLKGIVSTEDGRFVRASVIAKNKTTGVAREALTGETGKYAFSQLTPGLYDLSVESPDALRKVVDRVTVAPGAESVVDFVVQYNPVDRGTN